ncbi:MAG TPA: protein BatD [Bacteroidetes bacterium]|nr:protein BatD [Bacteroidota bacterium]
MMKILRNILYISLLIISNVSFAQDANLKLSSSSNTVAVGQSFRVTVELEGAQAEAYRDPDFNGFRIIGKSSSSGSGGMTIIVNGKPVMNNSGSASWTYTLVAMNVGKYTIGNAKAKVKGSWINSNTATIDVRQGSGQNQQQYANQTQPTQQQNTNVPKGEDNALFLRAEVNKTNPYQGEQIILTYKLYTRIPVLQYVIQESPAFAGFWMENLLNNTKDPKQYNTTLNGTQYTVAEIRKIALFPQRSGNLSIEPQKIKTLVQVQSQRQSYNPFADFFGDDPFFQQFFQRSGFGVENQERDLVSNPINVTVRELPAPTPENFNGAVGSFSIETSIDKKSSYSTDDAISIKYSIKGSGNFALIDDIFIDFPKEFDVYEPEIRDEISKTAGGISGKRSFEYIVIPRVKGKYEIPGFSISYFDLDSKKYVNLENEAITLNVNKGSDNPKAVSSSGDIEYLNEDIRYINTKKLRLQQKDSSFYASGLYFLSFAIPLLVFLFLVILWRKRIKDRANIREYQRRKANKTAAKHLKEAKKLLQNKEETAFYMEISRALWGYLSHKFSIDASDLSLDNVKEVMKTHDISDESTERFIHTLNDCEFTRFAPGDKKDNMQAIFDASHNIILKIEEEIA